MKQGGKLSEDRVRRVKWDTDPLRLVAEYIGADQKAMQGSLRRVVMCRCPIHGDRTPSFAVYTDQPDTPYHCYGCGFHGDTISLVREKEGLSFREAVEWLERYFGIVPLLEGEEPRPTRVAEPTPEDEWQAIMPIPESALATRPLVYPYKHQETGQWVDHRPTREHRYLDAEGRLLFIVYRFSDLPKDAGKVRPLTWCRNKAGLERWKWLYPSLQQPECAHGRPLYGLDRLAANPDALVVVCEGEKDADAAGEMLKPKGAIAVGSSIGAWNARHTDWGPLQQRRVLMWPDANDPAGAHYAHTVATILREMDQTAEPTAATDPQTEDDEDLFA